MSERITVSVVLVNFRGVDDTITAIEHLSRLDLPADQVEIVVVDNDSGDDSVPRLRELGSRIVLVESPENLGFAGGCNLGVAHSSGEYVGFLNNDARPDPSWASAAVTVLEAEPGVGAVASRVLDWEGKRVDYYGSALTWFGMGYKPFTGDLVPTRGAERTDVLFGTGAAMFVRRSVYDDLGGFDERYFMFFEDVDFGWRLNLAGWRFAFVPESVAYHRHHASMTAFGSYREWYLLERNALFTLYKNLGDEALTRILPAALALSIRRSVAAAGTDSSSLDIRHAAGDETVGAEVPRNLLTGMYAIDRFVGELPALVQDRARIQSERKVPDASIWPLFGSVDAPGDGNSYYMEGYENIVNSFDVLSSPPRTKVLIITGDPIGARLAGPAIRAWNMAGLLTAEADADVRLLSTQGVASVPAPFELVHVAPGREREFSVHEAWADVIIFQGHAMSSFSTLRRSKKIIVVDVYDPMHLEQLEQAKELPRPVWEAQVADTTAVLNQQLARGDFFLCASERQRLFYLGQLAGLGRVNPANYADDPDLDGLIAVAPFGLSETPPRHERGVLRGKLDGIGRDDKIVIWSGGIYDWFDPETLIRAIAMVDERRGGVRLFFQGTKHPHPGVPEMAAVGRSRRLAEDLGILDSVVHFNESWVEYADRQNYLLEADAGVSTHFAHIETTFSFRTRILDYLWAGLPMVVTEGDHFAELVAERGLGIVVPAADAPALADALEKVLFDDAFREEAVANLAVVRDEYTWKRTLAPLVDFIRAPRPAGDRPANVSAGSAPRVASRSGLARDIERGVFYLRNGGIRLVLDKVRRRLSRR